MSDLETVFTETKTFDVVCNNITLEVTVKALSFGQTHQISATIHKMIQAHYGSADVNMATELSKILKLGTTIKNPADNSDVLLDQLPLSAIGNISEEFFAINFGPSKMSGWVGLTAKLETLVNQINPKVPQEDSSKV